MLIKDKDRVSFTPRLNFDLLLYAGHLDLVAFEKAMSCFSLLYLQHVRRAAVLALSTAAHNKPNLIKGLLLEMLQFLYDQTTVKAKLTCSSNMARMKKRADSGGKERPVVIQMLPAKVIRAEPNEFMALVQLLTGLLRQACMGAHSAAPQFPTRVKPRPWKPPTLWRDDGHTPSVDDQLPEQAPQVLNEEEKQH
ncbi:hypothetical protein HPP92_002432 [Vanilla planifolia]|uniref:VQ domain-containing protein n=1 Tax=Vanilla planifolia TaxID=51239 RepID=A0A835VMD1_VANPL|nr:hypothetical protein HPP92_002432 [Vanilla planifolia]